MSHCNRVAAFPSSNAGAVLWGDGAVWQAVSHCAHLARGGGEHVDAMGHLLF
jgi:hypothetical protein